MMAQELEDALLAQELHGAQVAQELEDKVLAQLRASSRRTGGPGA
jgi:hypothetical protein